MKKLSLKLILKEVSSLRHKVDTGQEEVHQTVDKGRRVKMFYKGGVLHREEGPAVLPDEASLDVPAYEGGEYYLYGKQYPNFQSWNQQVEQLQSLQSTIPALPAQDKADFTAFGPTVAGAHALRRRR